MQLCLTSTLLPCLRMSSCILMLCLISFLLQPVPTVSDSVQVVLALASHCLGSIISFPLILPLPYCSPSCHPSFYCTALQTIPTVDDSVDVVLAALARHGLSSAAVLGHSYGSLVAARLVRLAPEVVHTLAVVDPVSASSFLLLLSRLLVGLWSLVT